MKKILSKLYTINSYDALKAVAMFFLCNLGELVYQASQMWSEDNTVQIDWKEMVKVATVATIMYLIKQFFTGTKQPLTELPAEPKEIKP